MARMATSVDLQRSQVYTVLVKVVDKKCMDANKLCTVGSVNHPWRAVLEKVC